MAHANKRKSERQKEALVRKEAYDKLKDHKFIAQ